MIDGNDGEEDWPEGWPTREQLRSKNFVRLSVPRMEVRSRPRVGQYYWVNFPHDAWKPEFYERHPCIIIRSARKSVDDTCIVVPVTSKHSSSNIHSIKLSVNPNPFGQRDGVEVWAVCDHIYTVHLNRLRLVRDLHGSMGWGQLSDADLLTVFAGVRKALHRVVEDLGLVKPTNNAEKVSE